MTSDNLKQYVKYIPEYSVLVCIQHGYCMMPGNGIKNHFQEFHQAITFEMRKQIIEYGESITMLHPNDVSVPNWNSKAINGLKVIENGLQCIHDNCEGCITISPDTMKRHCRKRHGWTDKEEIKWKIQPIQTFFTVSSTHDPTTFEALVDGLLQNAANQDEEHERMLDQVHESSLVTLTPWLRRTGWTRIFRGKNMKTLSDLTLKPMAGEAALLEIWNGIERIIRRSYNGVIDCWDRGWTLIPFWLISTEKARDSSRPFRMHFADSTIVRYISYWQRFFMFCLRSLENPERFGVEFRDIQKLQLNELQSMVELDNVSNEKLDEKILKVSIEFVKHADHLKERSVLLYFMNLLGYDVDHKQWRQAGMKAILYSTDIGDFTPILAGFQFCIRVLLLEHCLPTDDRKMMSESVMNPVPIFRQVHNEWLVEGEPTPFNYIHKLLNYGLHIGKDTKTRIRVRWSADGKRMYFDGRGFKISRWKQFIKELLDAAEEMMSKHLLFNGQIPATDLYFTDNMTNRNAGHYFASRKETVLKRRNTMLKRLYKSDGWEELMENTGDKLSFLQAGVDEYLKWDEKFRELLCILIILTCGQAGRGTEMTSLLYMNTMEMIRNVLVEDGQFMIITEYHKSMAIMDKVKIIARFLPHRISQLLGIYLTDIIPFRFLIKPDTSRNGFLFGNEKGPWETDKLSKVLIRESTKRLGFRMTMADYRHISIAMDRKFIRDIDLELDEEDDEDDPHDLMAAHSTRTAVNHYGRQAELLKKLSPEAIEIFRRIADKWHAWLGLVSRAPRTDVEDEFEDKDEMNIPIKEQIQEALRNMYGPTETFKGKQEEAVSAVMRGTTPLLICLPTGGGKTLSFMLPALLKDAKTTVVITPLVALGDDLLRRCKEASISSFIYGKSRPREAKIVIVVTETANSQQFSQFILDLHLDGKLDRIVFDEAHKIVTDINYRPKLEHLKRLNLPVQFVFMTATMPHSLMEEFKKVMVLDSVYEVREASHKENFCYSVQVYDGDEDARSYEDIIMRRMECYGDSEKILVFARTKRLCDKLALRWGCGKYYSDAPEKKEDLKNWVGGLLVGTGSLGAGVDVAKIREVIHIGIPYGFINFDQESGRGGRKGETVISTILLSRKEWDTLQKMNPEEMVRDDAVMREFILTTELRTDLRTGCRRKVRSQYINGEEGQSCEEMDEAKLCDICSKRIGERVGESEGRKRRRDEEWEGDRRAAKRRYEERVERLEVEDEERILRTEWVEEFTRKIKGKCTVCWLLKGGFDGCEHEFEGCKELERLLGERYMGVRSRKIEFERNSCCFKCGLPGDMCEDYRGLRRCSMEIVVPMVLAGWLERSLGIRDEIEVFAGRKFGKVDDFCRWIQKKRRVLEMNGTNCFGVFEMIIDKYC